LLAFLSVSGMYTCRRVRCQGAVGDMFEQFGLARNVVVDRLGPDAKLACDAADLDRAEMLGASDAIGHIDDLLPGDRWSLVEGRPTSATAGTVYLYDDPDPGRAGMRSY
jgi:hypothetical protein